MISENDLLKAILEAKDSNNEWLVTDVLERCSCHADIEFGKCVKHLEMLGVVTRLTPNKFKFNGI